MDAFKKWSRAAGIRAVKTWAQVAVALIGTSVTLGEVDWAYILSGAALSAVLSVLTSVAGLPEAESPIYGGGEGDGA